MATTNQITEPERGRTRTHRLLIIGLALWTGVVILALWWLLRSHDLEPPDPVWVVQGSDPSKLSTTERMRDWLRLAHLNFQRVYPWVLFAPYVIVLTSRFHFERRRLPLTLAVHLAACAAFVFAASAVNSRVSKRVTRVVVVSSQQEDSHFEGHSSGTKMVKVEMAGSSGEFQFRHEDLLLGVGHKGLATGGVDRVEQHQTSSFMPTNLLPRLEEAMRPAIPSAHFYPLSTLLDFLAYGSLAGITHAFLFYGRYRERERRALFLESNLARARLSALQAQLQPHFLFNTLNAIATLLRRDPRAAETTLTSLSELLRIALGQSDRQEISLRDELHFLERYMEIQQTRFGDGLRFERQIDPDTLEYLVPTLLLQPLVENAIRHGIEPSGHLGNVRIAARLHNGRLNLTVEDDGVGLDSSSQERQATGIGLSNLRARLEALYGSEQSLELAARPEGGVIVRISIPARPASCPDPVLVKS